MNKKLHQIHDKFFKTVMADKPASIAFLQTYLPAELSVLLNYDSLKSEETTYLSKDLEASFADIVFQIELQAGLNLKISILLEHKSYVDNYTAFQVLEYLGLGYKKQLKSKQALIPIIPLVFYHGDAKWEYKEVTHFFKDYGATVQQFIPSYVTQFIDLKQYSDNQILEIRNAFLVSALLIQKSYSNPNNLIDSFLNIYNSFETYLDNSQFQSIFVYVFQNEKLDNVVITEKIKALPPSQKDKIMSIYDQLIEQGRSKGMEQGIEQGIERGIERGIEQGIERGIEISILNAFDNNIDLKTIRLITGETVEKIQTVLLKNNRKL